MCNSEESIRDILLILKSAGINYPILDSCKQGFPKLILVITGEGHGRQVINLLADARTPILDEHMDQKTLKHIFSTTNSRFIIYPYIVSRKGNQFLEELSVITRQKVFSGNLVRAQIVAVSEGLPPGFPRDNVFTIFLEADLSTVQEIPMQEIVPTDGQVAVVLDKIQTCVNKEQSHDAMALQAATCFLYPCLPIEERDIRFNELLTMATVLDKQNEDNLTSAVLTEPVLEQLTQWLESICFTDVFELPFLGMEPVKNLEYVILYDDDYVYINERLFKTAIDPLTEVISITVILSSLVEEGLLYPESKATYTAKAGYYDIAGQYHRARMLRFIRRKMKLVGEMGIIEQCMKGVCEK